jgi:hypothetical protein
MAIASGAAAVVGGVTQSIIAAKKAKAMESAIRDYKRQTFDNAYADTTVSTLSAKLQQEELARATATSVQALQERGVRGVAGVGILQENAIKASRAIGADLDKQKQTIDQLRAQDEVRIQEATEAREVADLQGLGTALNVQQQNTANGINTAFSGAGSFASAFADSGGGGLIVDNGDSGEKKGKASGAKGGAGGGAFGFIGG